MSKLNNYLRLIPILDWIYMKDKSNLIKTIKRQLSNIRRPLWHLFAAPWLEITELKKIFELENLFLEVSGQILNTFRQKRTEFRM